MYYFDNKHTVYYIFEEVPSYTLNQVKLTTVTSANNKLLKGIGDNQTIGTFSAPYATVIPDGVTAYYATQEYSGGSGIVWLTPITERAIPACQGVILIGEVEKKTVTFEPATTESLANLSDNVLANTATGDVYAGESDIPQALARESGFNRCLWGDAFHCG